MSGRQRRQKARYDHIPSGELRALPEGEQHNAPLDLSDAPSLRNWEEPAAEDLARMRRDVALPCGWGRLLFGHTFTSNEALARTLLDEREGQRDVALYIRDPHVVLALAPQELFLDPSHTFRLDLGRWRGRLPDPSGFTVRTLRSRADVQEINRLFALRGMVPVDEDFVWDARADETLRYLVASDDDGNVLGTVLGVDHVAAFDDPEGGSSLWTLAVDPQARQPGVGSALIAALAGHYRALGRHHLDLSVLADNRNAISLYRKLGFRRVPAFCVKRKHNPINEPLYTPPEHRHRLNPYATIIVDEALRRGIGVDVLDEEFGYFALTHGGRRVVCRESLSELTSAVAMSRCADKRVTHRVLSAAGLRVPDAVEAGSADDAEEFLQAHDCVVVKPVAGEQGRGITVGVRSADDLRRALERAGAEGDGAVLVEEFVAGQDLRIVVIGGEVVAAAVRRPPSVVGDGRHTVEQLVRTLSRRREAATGGESSIPLDDETRRCVREAGADWDAVLEAGREIVVRRTANLHTGGTIHDVTAALHPELAAAAVAAAEALGIPVVGLDFLVPDVGGSDYVIIEANERPGLANHEPQPTAERFVDLLFPTSARRAPRGAVG